MKLELGFGELLSLDQISQPIIDLKVWREFTFSDFNSYGSQNNFQKNALSSNWMRSVSNSYYYQRPPPRRLDLLSGRYVTLFYEKINKESRLLSYLRLWSQFFEYLTFGPRYQLDKAFEPKIVVCSDGFYLIVIFQNFGSQDEKRLALSPSEWEYIQLGHKSVDPLTSVSILYNFITSESFNESPYFLTSLPAIKFVKFLIQSGYFSGFIFEDSVTHEQLNFELFFTVLSVRHFHIAGFKSLPFGFSILESALCYRNHKWLLR